MAGRGNRTAVGVPAAACVAVLVLLCGLGLPGQNAGPLRTDAFSFLFSAGPSAGTSGAAAPSIPLDRLLAAPLAPVPDAAGVEARTGDTPDPGPANTSLLLLFTLGFRNGSRLGGLLSSLNDPASPDYHAYVSEPEFVDEFAPNASTYADLLEYLGSFGIASVTSYPDRLAVSVLVTPSEAASVLHVPVERYDGGDGPYWAASGVPSLPSPLTSMVAAVEGLGPGSVQVASVAAGLANGSAPSGKAESARGGQAAPLAGGAPAPVTEGGVQYLYPSDLQAGYDEQSLLDQYGSPKGSDIASILWAGSYDGSAAAATACGTVNVGEALGPYDPADLTSFFAHALPSSEPVPTVVNVPVDGSPPANCTASYDTSGVVAANTAQLETLGSLAPGATIYGVTAPGPTITGLVAAFDAVLSPPSGVSKAVAAGLENVSVLEVGWGTKDNVSLGWLEDLEQAEVRGMTVVAAAGDSGDNPRSVSWVGTDAEFPASSTNNTAGDLAVGGTTLVLNATTGRIESQVVWNVSAGDIAEAGPAGTAGGISTVFSELAFQRNTSANSVIDGAGRGLPDVTAVANNSLVTLTINGTQYLANNATNGGPFRFAYGTALSAAYVAGILAEIDHVLSDANDSWLGFVDPTVYSVGNEQYSPAPSGTGITSTPTGSYDSALPTTPFYDVVAGRNDVYKAGTGYDLVSGWGSIDATNFTMYVLRVSPAGTYGALTGVRDRLRLTGLSATSRLPSGKVDTEYNASVQETLFVANALGAPVYWAQSLVYLHRTSGGAWGVNYTAWVSYPFQGFYPREVVREVWFPASGQSLSVPISLTLTTRLVPASGSTPPELVYTFGPAGSPTLILHLPGAAFIIGQTGYSYYWQGTKYTDGPTDGTSAAGYLAPQLDLVGAPPNATGDFGPGTAGNLSAAVEVAGSSVFSPAKVFPLTAANVQTGALAENVSYEGAGTSGYNLSYGSGSTVPGVYQVAEPYYPVTFTQTGVPDGATWYVNLSNDEYLSGTAGTPSVTTSLENGSYGWTATIDVRNWSSVPASGTIVVNGAGSRTALVFGPSFGELTFRAHGPETSGLLDFDWFVNISGQPSHDVGNVTSYSVNLSFGSYTYRVACTDPGYVPTKPTGTRVVGATPQVVAVNFTVLTYTINFVFHLPSSPPRLTFSFGGYSQTGSFATWSISEPKGSYGWSVTGLPFGYTASPSSGTVVVNGPVKPIEITIHQGLWGPFGLGWAGYALVGAAAGIAAVWTAVFLWRRSRRRRRAPEDTGEAPTRSPPPVRRRPPRRQREIPPDQL